MLYIVTKCKNVDTLFRKIQTSISYNNKNLASCVPNKLFTVKFCIIVEHFILAYTQQI